MWRFLRSVRPGLDSGEPSIVARTVGASLQKLMALASGSPRRAEDPASYVAYEHTTGSEVQIQGCQRWSVVAASVVSSAGCFT